MAVTTPTGYTALGQLNQSAQTNDTSMNVSYKVMGGTPDTAVTIPGTGNNAFGEAYSIQVFRGVSTSTPMDVTSVSAGATGTGRPDPAAITPVTAGAWVVICGGGAAGTGANYTAPANYTTNFLTANGADTTDAMVGSGYWTGWTSGAENPAAYTGGTTGATDSWASYTLAIRPEPAAQSLTPGLFTSGTNAFYAATVSPGAVGLTPGLFTNSSAFYTATVTPGTVELTPGLFTNSGSFYSPVVDQPSGSQNLTPTLYSNGQTFYSAVVTVGAVALEPALAINSQSFFAPTVSPGAVDLTPSLFTNSGSFYTPTVAPGAVSLTPALLSNAQAFYTATVAQSGPQELAPSLVANSAQFYGPTVQLVTPPVEAPSYAGSGGHSARDDYIYQLLKARRTKQITEQNKAIIMTIMQAVASGAIE